MNEYCAVQRKEYSTLQCAAAPGLALGRVGDCGWEVNTVPVVYCGAIDSYSIFIARCVAISNHPISLLMSATPFDFTPSVHAPECFTDTTITITTTDIATFLPIVHSPPPTLPIGWFMPPPLPLRLLP